MVLFTLAMTFVALTVDMGRSQLHKAARTATRLLVTRRAPSWEMYRRGLL
jgi:hypothetical protein